jgi:HlyD family secretion protein
MNRKKLLIGMAVVVVLGALAYANLRWERTPTTEVTVEKIARHDLEAIVSASGKVEPARQVNISAETMGRVVSLSVVEGQDVKVGQPLLEIDPRNLETAVQNREASLATARATLDQTRTQVENARVNLQQAKDTLRRSEGMWEAGLIAREQLERDQNAVKMRETDLLVSEQSVKTQEQRIRQEQANLQSARNDLTKVQMVSPINGIVTRRNIELGETAVVGTMNNAGTVLLTIADMGVIETEIEVDETDVPFIRVGQPARITIDALPNQTFPGRVTEVGNSPIQATGAAATGRAEITTATRSQALGVPIQAMTVRELVVDAQGQIVPAPAPPAGASEPVTQELQPGQSRKEIEGVFVVRSGKATFVPVATGIAGERFFEVLNGLQEGDEVITGPFASVRSMRDGDTVTITTGPAATGTR